LAQPLLGDFFPNTFYAKSGGGAYFSQGARFLLINAAALGLFAASPLIVVGAVRGRRLIEVQFAVLASGVYLAYVAKIGGDFMLGRLLVSVVPLAALLADQGLRELVRVRRVGPFLSAAAAPLLAVFWLPNGVVRPGEKYFHIADERTFYELKQWFPPVVGSGQLPATKALEKHFVSAGLSPVLGIGCTGLVGFETRLPIVDNFGLTDPVIARMPLGERGRPGHEKLASPGHLLARNVSFADIEIYPPPWRAFTEFTVSGVRYFWARYDRQLFTALRKQRQANVFPVEQYLDQLATQQPAEPDAFWCEHAFWSEFYFSREPDAERRARLIERAVRGDASLEGLNEFLFTALEAEPSGFTATTSFDFEAAPYAGWSRSGDAFSRWPRLEMAVPGQSAVYGQSGRYVSSFTEQLKDRAAGALRSERFKLDGDVLTFRISGGGHAAGVSVTLLVEDKPVLSASGCDQELMGRRVWNIAQYRGRDAVLEIMDRGRGRWAHVNADEFRVWKRK
jgi:hypothetical protein